MDTAVELDFADGKYRFCLPLPQVIELERKGGGKSIFTMYDQLASGLGIDGDIPVYVGGGAAMITDLRETVRLGLIGGNHGVVNGESIQVGPIRARELVEQYVDTRPAIEGMHIAWSILHAAIVGIQLKKKAEPEKPAPRRRSTKAK